jgi:hypothetical protein
MRKWHLMVCIRMNAHARHQRLAGLGYWCFVRFPRWFQHHHTRFKIDALESIKGKWHASGQRLCHGGLRGITQVASML